MSISRGLGTTQLTEPPAQPSPARSPTRLSPGRGHPTHPRQPGQDLGRHDLRSAGDPPRRIGPGPAAARPERHQPRQPPPAPLTDGHLFGTDQLGRDLLSRVLHGGQVSLTIGMLAVIVSGVIGVVARRAAGYFGGWVDASISRLLEAQMSLPLLMMLLLVVALFGPSIPVITFVIAIAQWPEVARLTRSLVLVEREKPYVAAARVLGLRRIAILMRHVIPNVIKQVSLVVLLLLAQAVLLESALSYLGAGPQRPFATWGRIISDGQDYITTSWWMVTLPAW